MKRSLLLFLATTTAWGACHVVTPTGSGTNSGANWSNACAGFTGACADASLVRGDSYYVGKGTYSAGITPGFSKANSGTLTITVKAVTDADNCSSTGYVSATHKGQAVFTDQIVFSTDYWILDGQYGTEYSKGSYGIKIVGGATIDSILKGSGGMGNSTIRYVEVQGNGNCDGGNSGQVGIYPGGSGSGGNNALIEHNYVYQVNNHMKINFTSGVTARYNLFTENYSGAACHGENIAMNATDTTTVAYNKFENCRGTACIAAGACGVCDVNTNTKIHGNVFSATTNFSSLQPDPLSSGLLWGLGGSGWSTVTVYNNTVTGWTSGTGSGAATFISGGSGSLSGADVKNNLFYNNQAIDVGGNTCGSNSFYSTTRSSSACTGDQTGGVGNPMVSPTVAQGTAPNFHLASDTSAWTALASPYNVDPDGVTRTSSRGAFQYLSGGSTAPSVTTSAVSSVTTTTATGNGNVTSDGGDTVTARGVCWSTSPSPTLSGTCAAAAAGGTGTFTASITGLTPSVFYYVAAYATNGVGTSYGSDVTFTSSASSTATAGISGKASLGGKASIH